MNTASITVVAIDGPSASGKGSVAQRVAKHLGYGYLDSGALYRIVAHAAQQQNVSWQDAEALAALARGLRIEFHGEDVLVNGQDVGDAIRSEAMGKGASEVAVHGPLRAALLDVQHDFRQAPGLVADGRDMATVVFPDAAIKIFLTAAVEIRAERRYKQLLAKGAAADLSTILEDLKARDARDQQRAAAPLVQAEDAVLLDTSAIDLEQSVAQAIEIVANNKTIAL